jgi:hypothetical protein
VTILQNSFLGDAPGTAVMFDGDPQARTIIANNLFGVSEYGVFGSGYGEGSPALARYAPGGILRGNAIVGRTEQPYPRENMFPATTGPSDFVNVSAGDYTVRANISWSSFSGKLVGINGRALLLATQGAVTR